MMTPSLFEKRLALHGADLSRWPRDEIKAALLLMESSSRAAAVFAAAERADHLLRFHMHPAPAVPTERVERIIRQARYIPQEPAQVTPASRLWTMARIARVAGSLLLAAVMGFTFSVSGERSPAFAADGLSYMGASFHGAPQDIIVEEDEDFR